MGDEYYKKPSDSVGEGEPNWDEIFRPRPQPPLSEKESEHVAQQKELFMQHMPEFYPFFHEASKLGLADGWRSVKVTIFEKNEDE